MVSQRPTETSSAGPSPERRIADLTILYEVSRALQRTFEEEKALYTILTGVTHGRGLGFNRAFILLVDSDGKSLDGRLAIGPSSREEAAAIWKELRERHQSLPEILEQLPSPAKRDLRVNEIVSRFRFPLSDEEDTLIRILHSREACLAHGGTIQPHGWPVDPWLSGLLGTSAFAIASLHLAGRDLGLIIADNSITGLPITPASLQLLQIYAQAASASIQSTRLYRELKNKVEVCENTNRMLRDSQEHLLRAERLSTIGKMAALLAHEIRTPLVSIGGFARRLWRQTSDEDSRKEEMHIIVSEVTRLERMIEEVLGYTRIAKPECESTDLNDLIRNIVATMEDRIERNGVRTAQELSPALPPVSIDKFQIRQALMNLIDNALDAMPAGGTLTLTTGREGAFLEIGVADTGIGIAREHWSKLFLPFFTTKSSGTGLGLAIVSQVVENHGGSLRFASVAGQGSFFHIRLPIEPPGRATELKPDLVVD